MAHRPAKSGGPIFFAAGHRHQADETPSPQSRSTRSRSENCLPAFANRATPADAGQLHKPLQRESIHRRVVSAVASRLRDSGSTQVVRLPVREDCPRILTANHVRSNYRNCSTNFSMPRSTDFAPALYLHSRGQGRCRTVRRRSQQRRSRTPRRTPDPRSRSVGVLRRSAHPRPQRRRHPARR